MPKLTYKGKVPYSLNTGFSFKQIKKGDVVEVTENFAKVLLANHPKDWVKTGKAKKSESKRNKGGKNA